MILVCGCCDEIGCEWFLAHLIKWDIDFTLIDERELGKTVFLNYSYVGGKLNGCIDYVHWNIDLSRITGVYNRIGMLEEIPPELMKFHFQLNFLLDNISVPVFNRPKYCHTNYAKAIQYKSIIEVGLKVPNSFLGNFKFVNPNQVNDKLGVVKSISSYRSKVKRVIDSRSSLEEGYHYVHQYQEELKGNNIRVHVVGSDVHSVLADTKFLDYRYAPDFNEELRLVNYSLPNVISESCLKLSRLLQLNLSGIDLFHDQTNGDWYCFEINTSPGYSWFEKFSKATITESLVKCLT